MTDIEALQERIRSLENASKRQLPPNSAANQPFLNVFEFNKGYHRLLEAMRHGQLCCRPNEADEQFGDDKVL